MTIGGQGIDVSGLHVQRKCPQPLDGIHEKEALPPFADLPDGVQIHAEAAEILHEADGEQFGAGAGLVDPFQRVLDREPFDRTVLGLQA